VLGVAVLSGKKIVFHFQFQRRASSASAESDMSEIVWSVKNGDLNAVKTAVDSVSSNLGHNRRRPDSESLTQSLPSQTVTLTVTESD